uniref:Zinc knuckle CX2CX4HX4C n=1 Tax=Tanacetum cinerariifolium TaxID=118510 RepID=A0A699HJF7_TANCI|nr:hypothetical protein [Tanacetum cinerariifolium]
MVNDGIVIGDTIVVMHGVEVEKEHANVKSVTTESNANESGLDLSLSAKETITHEASIPSQANSIYANKNGGEEIGNEPINEFPSSYAIKLIPTSLTKANLRKLEANAPKDDDYDVWLPLALIYEVKERMKSSLYSYFISKRLAFPVVECHARVLIEINDCNDFSDNMVMVVSKLEGNRNTKETIRIKYEWVPPHCSTCLIYGHSRFDCLKVAHKQLVNGIDKGKVRIRLQHQVTIKSHQEIKVMDFLSLSNSFEALHVESLIIKKVATCNKATTSGTQEERKSFTLLVEKINVFEKQMLKGKLVLLDNDRKPLEKVDYPGNTGSEDEVKPADNETASYLASKLIGV